MKPLRLRDVSFGVHGRARVKETVGDVAVWMSKSKM